MVAQTADSRVKRLPWCTVSIALLALMVQGDGQLAALATLDREATLSGEWWRLASGHLAHWSAAHLGWDMFGWLIAGSLCECRGPRRFRLAIGIGGPALSIALLLLQPELQLYRGLSGLLAIGLGLWTACWWREGDPVLRTLAVVLGLVFITKIVVEQFSGACLMVSASTIPPVPLAHLLGYGIGLGTGLFARQPARTAHQHSRRQEPKRPTASAASAPLLR